MSEEWTAIARRYWDKAGLASRITLKLAPALDTLRALPAAQAFDFAFIDADKTNYRHYYEEVLRRMRAGGLILIDNVLWSGAVLDPNDQSDDTRAIRASPSDVHRNAPVFPGRDAPERRGNTRLNPI